MGDTGPAQTLDAPRGFRGFQSGRPLGDGRCGRSNYEAWLDESISFRQHVPKTFNSELVAPRTHACCRIQVEISNSSQVMVRGCGGPAPRARLARRFQIPAEWRQTDSQTARQLDHRGLISVPVVSWHQANPPSGRRPVAWRVGDLLGRTSCASLQCPVRGARVWLRGCACASGQARPQGEISNVTLVLGHFEMAAAEQEGKEDCGD